MTAPNKTEALITLATTDELGSVHVKSLEFARFEAAMSRQLDQLIEQWKAVAAPNSARPAREASRRKSKPE